MDPLYITDLLFSVVIIIIILVIFIIFLDVNMNQIHLTSRPARQREARCMLFIRALTLPILIYCHKFLNIFWSRRLNVKHLGPRFSCETICFQFFQSESTFVRSCFQKGEQVPLQVGGHLC